MNPQILGIGGAFVDLTFHVSDERLAALQVPKAGISFVDRMTQDRLIQTNSASFRGMTHGGSVANSICTSQLLGTPSGFAAAIGLDASGKSFVAELTRRGIHVATTLRIGDTNSILVFITPDGEKTFVVYPKLAGTLAFNDIDSSSLHNSRWIAIEGQLLSYGESSKATALEVIHTVKKSGANIAFNLGSVSVVAQAQATVLELVEDGYIDLLIGNREEFARLLPGMPPLAALDHLSKHARYTVVTAGADGAMGHYQGHPYKTKEMITREVVDSSGAGDAFLGALLAGINSDADFQLCLDIANQVAAEVVSQSGARLDTVEPEIVKRILKESV
jgi:ribokinase